MLFTTALSLFLVSWSGLFLTDYVFRILNWEKYLDFVDRHGLQISPFQLRMYTSQYEEVSLNAHKKVERKESFFKKLWFDMGCLVTLMCTIFITWYLTTLLWTDFHIISDFFNSLSTLSPSTSLPTAMQVPEQYVGDGDMIDHPRDSGLTPILPGVNMPWEHIPLFMVVLIVAAVLHELGHSLAATYENVRVNGFGIFIIGLYPGAFTEIDDQSLKRCTSWCRLRIYCGGIWHNLVLALFGYLVIVNGPTFLAPLYVQGQGITVQEISHQSGLYGGLLSGQVVVGLDNCQVFDITTWLKCIHLLQLEKNGRCVEERKVKLAKAIKVEKFETEIHCCEDNGTATAAHLCFENEKLTRSETAETVVPSLAKTLQLGKFERPLELRRVHERKSRELSCLNARWVTQQPICNETEPCKKSEKLSTKPICVYPALYNGSKLVRVEIANTTRAVLFVGRVEEFLFLVEASPLVARWFWVPNFFPAWLELFGKYLLTLSLALGVLNAVPCYALDGQHIVITLVQALFRGQPKRRRHQMINVCLIYGSFILATNILIGFLRLYRNYST